MQPWLYSANTASSLTAKQSFLFSLSYTFRVRDFASVQMLLSDGECQGLCAWPHRSDHTEFRLQYPNYTCSPVRWQTSNWAPAELASLAPSIVADMASKIESPQMRQATAQSSTPLVKRKKRSLMFVKMCIKPNSFKVSVLILVADDDEDDFPLRVTIK